MDTEVTRDQQFAPKSTTARPAEEFGGSHDAAAIEQILHASIDDHAKGSDATADAVSLADRFAGTVYFAEKVADCRPASGAASIRSNRGRRTSARPWRLPASNRNPKN
ncbi:hypothetical protein ACIA03_22135 [Nocardioides sp. NPDC051685]|uniref:hypothetical protein n=1 Tax=Nocardioides sp. NPDC051685 TaxID=3364334 RepID=UPI00379AF6C2